MNSRIIFKNLSKLNASYVSCANKSYALRSARFMAKIMHGSKKRSRWYPEEKQKPSTVNFLVNSKGNAKVAGRRQTVLNHVFMTHIVELMSTGHYASEIQDQNISITRVKVHPDFKGVNIYWYKKSGVVNEDTEKLLQKLSSYLRFEMCALQVIGLVPPVIFVKDRTFSNEAEIASLLKIADFPDDYTPLGSLDTIKSDLGYDDVRETDPNAEEDPLPEMKNTVFGLNHSKIMARIQADISKRISVHSGDKKEMPLYQLNADAVEFNKKDFASYLREKQKAKALASEKHGYAELEDQLEEESDWEYEEESDYENEYEYEYEYKDKEET